MKKNKSKIGESMSTYKQKFKWKRTDEKEKVAKVETVKNSKKHRMKEKNVQKKHERPKHSHGGGFVSNSILNSSLDVWKGCKLLNIMKRDKPLPWIDRKLPSTRSLELSVPWSLDNEGVEAQNVEPCIPPCVTYKDFVSKASLQQLDIELGNFAKFVRLTDNQILARKNFISEIESLLSSMWPQVKIQQFGSFATEEVCTFASDVDLAFWGIVPSDDGGTGGNEWNNGSVCMSQESYRRTMEAIERKKKKRERVLAWEKLLSDLDKQSLGNESERSEPNIDEGNEDLFIIDRTGVKVVDSEEAVDIKNDADSDGNDSVDKMSEYHRRERDIFTNSKSSLSSSNLKNSESDEDFSAVDDFPDDERNRTDFDINISSTKVTYFGAPLSELIKGNEMDASSRTKVVNALVKLGKRLWKQSYTQNVQVRKKARVPIICMTTRYGFDVDMAIGGHNGIDTSHYVRKCIEKFESFSTVVLFLKILLQQTDLDKPFTGGLGSYRLYVLVAHHFNKHINIGGGVSAAEILLSFLYRYSSYGETGTKARTYLDKSYTIFSEDGEADLSAVNVEDCVEIFRLCFQKLIRRLSDFDNCHGKRKLSLITCLIDVVRLKRERVAVVSKTQAYSSIQKVPDDHPGKVTVSSRPISHTFSKHSHIPQQLPIGESKHSTSVYSVGTDINDINIQSHVPEIDYVNSGKTIPKTDINLEYRVHQIENILQDIYESRKSFRITLIGNGATLEITSLLGPIKNSFTSDAETGERIVTFASNDHSFEFHVNIDQVKDIMVSEEKNPSEGEEDVLRLCRFLNNDGVCICSLILVDKSMDSVAWFHDLMKKYA